MEMLPACHPYIQTPDGTPDHAMILAAAHSAFCKNPNLKQTWVEITEHLLSAAIIPTGFPLDETSIPNHTCFDIAQKNKCTFICHLCPLSSLFKNGHVEEETTILSLSLKSWEDLCFIRPYLKRGLFQGQLLINPKPVNCVPTLPLHRLTYEYLTEAVNKDTSFKKIPALVAEILLEKNRDKLRPENNGAIERYLTNLQERSVNITRNQAIHALQILDPDTTATQPEHQTAKSAPAASSPKNEESCLEGLLKSAPTSPLTKDRSKPLLPPKQPPLPEVSSNEISPANATIHPRKSADKKDSEKIRKSNKNTADPVKLSKSNFIPDVSASHLFKKISDMDNASLKMEFEEFLLLNPELAIEVIKNENTKAESFLLYGSGLFYFFDLTEEEIKDILSLYVAKSKRRLLICYEPYRLIRCLYKNRIPFHNLASLQTAATVMNRISNSNIKPGSPLDIVCSSSVGSPESNSHPYLDTMPLYTKAWMYLSGQKDYTEHSQQFVNAAKLDTLLGISYDLNETTHTQSVLFTFDAKLRYLFSYKKHIDKMRDGFLALEYRFALPTGTEDTFMTDMLLSIARQNLFLNYCCRLLSYSRKTLLLAVQEQDAQYLCEFIFSLATKIGNNLQLSPVSVTEIIIRDSS